MSFVELLRGDFQKNTPFVVIMLVLCAIVGTPCVLFAHPDNVLPLTLNADVYAEASAGGSETDSGINSASVWAQDSLSDDFDGDGMPDIDLWASAESEINCSSGDWGAGMASSLTADSMVMMGDSAMALMAYAATGTSPTGSLTIGTSAVLPVNSEVTLWVEIDTDGDSWGGGFYSYQFQLLRGSDILIEADWENPDPFGITAYAGEILSIEFLHEAGANDGMISHDVGVDFWVVPEPATMSLLAIGGLAMIRRRRK